MASDTDPQKPQTHRHKCPACYKKFNRKLHLIEHMKISYHSVHQPRCWVCQKHCKSFESVREHINNPLSKTKCSKFFAERGCTHCLRVLDSSSYLDEHKKMCRIIAPVPLGTKITPCMESNAGSIMDETQNGKVQRVIAMDCEMVGGGSDGSIDLCSRVCLVDEDENIILHTYVQPQIPVTNYRYEVTGLTEDHLKDAMPLNEVQDKITKILYNGKSVGSIPPDGGMARLLVGHGIRHDLDCLRMKYPGHMQRDTAKYHPLMKTNLVSHSLKHLTKTYLGYDIQSGIHDPYEDSISMMRLYKRMRDQDHEQVVRLGDGKAKCGFDSFRSTELDKKTPDELYEISVSDYKCWCLDLSKDCNRGS
ncbi:apoptosis-enhancing nuclease-like [Hibiscus syriacus]|uniref:apoptosis-enhancing nuclease-like n=1 Tax=Hibiscus syriacus TaxID=106335 RepID=UPI001922DDC3|nr:apoptosis-enhancing nuclease-like [Hibiscus syriacus]